MWINFTSPGYTPWPGIWESDTPWVPKEGWSLQPWLPHNFANPMCLVGRGNVWMNWGTKYKVNEHRSFRTADLNTSHKMFVGTILMGAHYRHKEPGKIVIHDMVSDAPFPERIAMAKEILKNKPVFEVCDPVPQDTNRKTFCHRAPVEIYKSLVRSETTLYLGYYQ